MANEFEREKLIYEEANESVRRLDQSMWQVPLVGTTLTGGLWFGVATTENLPAYGKALLMAFAMLGDLFLILVLVRLKQVIDLHLWQIRKFERRPQLDASKAVPKPSNVLSILLTPFRRLRVVYSFAVLLGAASILSALGAVHYLQPSEVTSQVKLRSFVSLEPVAENDTAIAVRDDYPVSPGHTLIIPKRTVGSVFELSNEELLDCWALLKSERERLIKEVGADGFNIGVNDGQVAGQTVARAHIHLIPRFVGDHPEPEGGVRSILPGKSTYNP